MDWLHPLAGLLVGIIVGMTGVGGGSLMAPLLIFLVGVAPTTAVGTDLWFAAITKLVGGLVHHRQGGSEGGPDYAVVRRLSIGSLPAALVVLVILALTRGSQVKNGYIAFALGIVLILTAIVTLLRGELRKMVERTPIERSAAFRRAKPTLVIVAGVILGTLVTLTSVGAGALGATMLVLLYPRHMHPQRLVATDIVHAIPLTLLAGLGHLWLGNVDGWLLLRLLIGSIPGIIVGSLLATRMSGRVLGPVLATVLLFAGWRLLSV